MKKSVVETQIGEMAQVLRSGGEAVEAHFLERHTIFSDGEDWMEFNMRFAPSRNQELNQELNQDGHLISETFSLNGAQDPRILVSDEGEATISYQDQNKNGIVWVEEQLDPEQQETLNQYAVIAGKFIQEIIGNMEDKDEDETTTEEDERELARMGLHPEKQTKFQELLLRTLVMGRSAAGDLKQWEEMHPETKEDRAAMETAFHYLLAAAIVTNTEWEPA